MPMAIALDMKEHEAQLTLVTQGAIPLKYSVHKYSSFSNNYSPNHILNDRPTDQMSRWSSDGNLPPQFVTLKLNHPAIVTEITFGKFEKTHMCNLKKFKVYGGMDDESMIELLDGGLANDSQPESFPLKHSIMCNLFPCKYIKIVPIQSFGPSFNFSIWYVSLKGNEDLELVKETMFSFNEYRQREAIRLCLKHLRQHNHSVAFESLLKRTRVQLEDEMLSTLHRLLVVEGKYSESESLIETACNRGLFDRYLRTQEYKPAWRPILPSLRGDRPGMRGGHQMCIDAYAEVIYLFGGWDGTQDLSDLWAFHIPSGEWTCVSRDTSIEGGPSARSCHKMCIDPLRKKIFTLGRYLDFAIRSENNLKSDFYVYDIESNKWTLITEDTAAMGGPKLMFDHQMCMDVEKNIIYVFGGRILSCMDEKPDQSIFSGLYTYHVPTNSWFQLREDTISVVPASNEIHSRIGHSMLFHDKLRLLYVFAGQRQKEYLRDFFTYNVDTKEIRVICDGEENQMPAAGFTQRATIDPDTNEIHVLSGSNKVSSQEIDRRDQTERRDSDRRDVTVKNSFWVYDILRDRWSCIYRNENVADGSNNDGKKDIASSSNPRGDFNEKNEPCPRFAHQLVYDHVKKVHYLFGGNPGKTHSTRLRLDDFWALELTRLSREQILRHCRRLIRQQAYKEIIQTDEKAAVQFLRTELAGTFNHDDPKDIQEFQLLAPLLFKEQEMIQSEFDPELNYKNRTKVFDMLVEFFPAHMTQPRENLADLVFV